MDATPVGVLTQDMLNVNRKAGVENFSLTFDERVAMATVCELLESYTDDMNLVRRTEIDKIRAALNRYYDVLSFNS